MRLYVGVPLVTPTGFNIGALCAIDTKLGDISPDQLNVMQDLARLVVDELELRKLASIDSLTGAMTGRWFNLEAGKVLVTARRKKTNVGCIMFDLDHFKSINDTHGHPAGDQVLRTIAAICASELRAADIFGRVGGEGFAIVLPENSMAETLEVAERLRAKFASAPVIYAGTEIKVTASFGATVFSETDVNLAATLKRADAALYEAKNGGRNRAVFAGSDLTEHEIAA